MCYNVFGRSEMMGYFTANERKALVDSSSHLTSFNNMVKYSWVVKITDTSIGESITVIASSSMHFKKKC